MTIKRVAYVAVCCGALLSAALIISANAQMRDQAISPVDVTLKNLMEAYNGESNANARYLAFAKKADEEGYGKAASLFRAAARAEQVHFERDAKIIKSLGGTPKATIDQPVVKSTKENVEAAYKGETYEKNVMYPEFLAQAEKANVKEAVDVFEDAQAAEGVHAMLYKEVLDNMDAWKGAKKDFYVCPLCGNVVDKLPAAVCPICATETKKFMMVS
ncbi:MAG: ferritin family protein [Candidatus Omnitrophica bacterium]|nr:ferritin family protein [Candidatus Omnitrophota bacterium]